MTQYVFERKRVTTYRIVVELPANEPNALQKAEAIASVGPVGRLREKEYVTEVVEEGTSEVTMIRNPEHKSAAHAALDAIEAAERKVIVYTINDNGIDGRERTTIKAAFRDEGERDTAFEADKNKAYLSKGEQIIDVESRRKSALAKLDGIDRLLLFPPGAK